MSTQGKKFFLAVGVLGAMLGAASPAFAQHGGGGGGGGHGGGGGGGGGGHAGGGGGAHFSGGSGGHFAGGHAAVGGHFAGGGGTRFVGNGHYAGGGFHGSPAGFHGGAIAGRPGYGGGRYIGRGYGYSSGAYWRGGYWGGGYWPRAWYGSGFNWFLPVLPLAYATYWWGGVPYYYANDAYYTYDNSYDGYVATDPPPISGTDSSGAAVAPSDAPASDPSQGGAPQGAVGQVFMYPKNGQSVEQQATDKAECQQWATQQAGEVAQNSSDYQRAMVACVEGRGYSAR